MTGEEQARHVLDNWKFWVGVAYVGMTGVVVALFILFSKTSHEEAVRVAEQQTAKRAQVVQCVAQAKGVPAIKAILNSIVLLANNSIIASSEAIRLAAPGDPLLHVRIESRRRAMTARTNVKKFKDLYLKQTPTIEKCRGLAQALAVNFQEQQ